MRPDNDTRCVIALLRGGTQLFAYTTWLPGTGAPNPGNLLSFPFVDTNPGAGTYTYKIQVRRVSSSGACRFGQRSIDSLTGQVLE